MISRLWYRRYPPFIFRPEFVARSRYCDRGTAMERRTETELETALITLTEAGIVAEFVKRGGYVRVACAFVTMCDVPKFDILVTRVEVQEISSLNERLGLYLKLFNGDRFIGLIPFWEPL